MTYPDEQHFIDAVHQDVLDCRKDRIATSLSEEIRALARVTYRYLHELKETQAKHLDRIRKLENEPPQ
jgi:hypothetical protein